MNLTDSGTTMPTESEEEPIPSVQPTTGARYVVQTAKSPRRRSQLTISLGETMKELSVVYGSGIGVWDSKNLSTLCIFYDRVYLPASDSRSSGTLIEFSRKKGTKGRYILSAVDVEGFQITPSWFDNTLIPIEDYVTSWERFNHPLFQEGVLQRLPAWPRQDEFEFDEDAVEEISDVLLETPSALRAEMDNGTSTKESIFIWQDHAIHLLRDDIQFPILFTSRNRQYDREYLKSLLALSAFRFVLPQLSDLHPDQVLEVRNAVADTREGFSFHLQSLSRDVENSIADGAPAADVARRAQSIVETTLIPDYMEFRRQLAAKRSGFWGNVLEKATKVAEIDAAPWTPKFYGELIKALGFTLLASISDREDSLSNREQAYQFLKAAEKVVTKST